MIADVNNRLYGLARSYSKNLPEEIPEGILYGYIKIATMEDDALRHILEEKGFDVETTLTDIKAARELIESRDLDIQLLKNGLQLILPKRLKDTWLTLEYTTTVQLYDDSVTMQKIVEDIMARIPDEELEVFKNGRALSDIAAYSKTITVESGKAEFSLDSTEIYSDVLSGYLADLKKIIPAFSPDTRNLLWSQSLLLSIDLPAVPVPARPRWHAS